MRTNTSAKLAVAFFHTLSWSDWDHFKKTKMTNGLIIFQVTAHKNLSAELRATEIWKLLMHLPADRLWIIVFAKSAVPLSSKVTNSNRKHNYNQTSPSSSNEKGNWHSFSQAISKLQQRQCTSSCINSSFRSHEYVALFEHLCGFPGLLRICKRLMLFVIYSSSNFNLSPKLCMESVSIFLFQN